MIKSTKETLETITRTIDEFGFVYFTRYGDGDIIQMTGKDLNGKSLKGQDRTFGGNRTRYTPQLEKDLQTTFKIHGPNYLKGVSLDWKTEPGMGKGLFEAFPYRLKLANKIKQFTNQVDFLNPVVFHYLITFKPELFDAFCEKYVKPKKKLYIGCVNPRKLKPIFGGNTAWIETIDKNAVQHSDLVWKETQRAIKMHKPELIIPSCGQASRSIHGKLWNSGYKGSVIDFGSLVDVFDNRKSRTWIRLKGDEIKARYGH